MEQWKIDDFRRRGIDIGRIDIRNTRKRIKHYRLNPHLVAREIADLPTMVALLAEMVAQDRAARKAANEAAKPPRTPAQIAAATLGAMSSKAKAAAARRNGAKGGRPKKAIQTPKEPSHATG